MHIKPLDMTAGPGTGIVLGHIEDPGGYLPVVRILNPDGSSNEAVLSGVSPDQIEREFAATVLSNGDVLAVYASPVDGGLLASFNNGPLAPLPGSPSSPIRVYGVYERAGGDVAVLYSGNWSMELFIWDPSSGQTGTVVGINFDPDYFSPWCIPSATGRNAVHVLCTSRQPDEDHTPVYTAFSLDDGSRIGEPEAVTDRAFIYEDPLVSDTKKIAVAPDGTVWVMFLLECDWERCPVLFRRSPQGYWSEPIIPGQAVGSVDMTVDSAGRVHLLYSTPLNPSMQTPAAVYHTLMEVVP
jgi:hypothetical protein